MAPQMGIKTTSRRVHCRFIRLKDALEAGILTDTIETWVDPEPHQRRIALIGSVLERRQRLVDIPERELNISLVAGRKADDAVRCVALERAQIGGGGSS